MSKIVTTVVLLPVRMYQRVLSPFLPVACRFHPTCSHYAIQAVEHFGVLRGGWLTVKRIARCHPWGSFGYDPVPTKEEKV